MAAMTFADPKTFRQTGLEIAQELKREEKRIERREQVRILLREVSDPLLNRAEVASWHHEERISGDLKTEIRRLEAQVFERVAAGPQTPQEAVERVLRAQETLLTWLQPQHTHADGGSEALDDEPRSAATGSRISPGDS